MDESTSHVLAMGFRHRASVLRTEAELESGERRNSKIALADEYDARADALDPDGADPSADEEMER